MQNLKYSTINPLQKVRPRPPWGFISHNYKPSSPLNTLKWKNNSKKVLPQESLGPCQHSQSRSSSPKLLSAAGMSGCGSRSTALDWQFFPKKQPWNPALWCLSHSPKAWSQKSQNGQIWVSSFKGKPGKKQKLEDLSYFAVNLQSF